MTFDVSGILARALAIGALTGLVACAPAGDRSSVAAARTLRVGLSDEPDGLNPFYTHTSAADDVEALLFAPLFRYDARGEFIPELAERVPTSANGDVASDGRRVTLRLRPNLRWSDGAPLTSRDLAFTARAVMNPRNSVKLRGGWANIARIETPDARTAILVLRAPDAAVLTLFAGGGDAAYPPLPAHLLEREASLDRADFNARPISSGPWILRAWERGGGMNFAPNPRYRRGAPRLEALRVRFFADRQSAATALLAHEIDLAPNVPIERAAAVRADAGLRLVAHDVAAYRHLDFNCRDATLADPRVRRALIEAADWPGMLARAYGERVVPATSDIFPASWAAPRIAPYPYAPDAAARLLDAAGWKRGADGMRARAGKPLELTLLGGTGNAAGARMQVLMLDAWRKIGATVRVRNMPAVYLFAGSGPLYGGTYQLAWMSDTRGPDPDNAATWSSDAMPPNGANTTFFRDARVDALARAARATFDRGARKRLYQREWERLHDAAPAYIATWQREYLAYRANFTGFEPAAFYSGFGASYAWRAAR